jgi:hypothetical protein
MNDSHLSEHEPSPGNSEELKSALFAHLVMQQSNMAMMLLGKTAHPETGQNIRDLEAAKLFIDLLEMLQSKTKGNLTPEEAALLKQSLMSLRMAYVETVDSPAPKTEPQSAPSPSPLESDSASKSPKAESASTAASTEEDHRKKFTKKY